MLDAYALAVALRSTRNVSDALRRFAALRGRHARFYQLLSALFTPVYQSESCVLPLLRDRLVGPMAKRWPANWILAAMVSGRLLDPLPALGLRSN